MAADPILSPNLQTESTARMSFSSFGIVRTRLEAISWQVVIVTLITAGAFVQRLHLVLGDSLPLGDGGMFYAVIEQIKANGYRLPGFISYDEIRIPFAYSPLTFYIAAGISDVLGIDTIEVMRFLPLIGSCLAIPAFYLLAKAILQKADASLVATVFFAAHASFVKLIMGGGLTRSFGLCFALLALYHLYRLTKDDPTPRRSLLASLFMALTVLSHQEMAWLVALFYLLFLCAFTRSWRDLVYPVAVATLSLTLTAPWWGIVLARHGIEPYLAALHSGTGSTLVSIGLLAVPLSRRWLVPSLLIASIYFGGRNVDFPLGISLALIAGAVSGWFLPRLRSQEALESVRAKALRLIPTTGAAAVVLILAVLFLSLTDVAIGTWVSRPPGEAASFDWIRDRTSTDSRFVVIADTDQWGYDHTGEWLPTLARRLTLTTVQGREWLQGAEGYPTAKARYEALRTCVTADTVCLEAWQPVQNVDYTHVYITKDDCCVALRESLERSDGYSLVYDGPGAQIYERLDPPEAE
jgi:Dolichyl-phosphate-mannose-protein mannosyltransferase